MSTEIRVFFPQSLPSRKAVQQSMHDLGFALDIADLEDEFDGCDGFLPMIAREGGEDEETGTEVYVAAARESIETYGIEDLDPALDREISFRWSSDALEGACAFALAAAIAKLTGGAIYDDTAGTVISIDAALQAARDSLKQARAV